ncbi:hypothetical protein MKX01_036741 [Papaver californicum]|nr:hypothetical protein MKX01_036741 [Papaver californicum]
MIWNFLEDYWYAGEWKIKFIEDCPQQTDMYTPFLTYFIKHLIRGIDLKLIDKEKILRYRREMVVQLFKKQFLEVNIQGGEI